MSFSGGTGTVLGKSLSKMRKSALVFISFYVRKEKKMKKKHFTVVAAFIAACLYAGLFTACGSGDSSDTEPTTWTVGTVSSLASYTAVPSIAYASGVGFVVGTGDGTKPVFAKSATGMGDWSAAIEPSHPNFNNSVATVRALNNKFIATRGSGITYALTSADGTSWTEASIGFGTKGFAYGNGTYLVSGGGGQVAHSSDMATWATVNGDTTGFGSSGSTSFLNAAAYGNNIFVIGGGQGRTAVSADKGVTWTLCELAGTASPYVIFDGDQGNSFITAMVFHNGKFIALGGVDNTVAKSAYSADGLAWTEGGNTGIKTGNNTPHMAAGGGYIVAVDTDGKAAYSADGIKWTSISISLGTGVGINDVAYGNGRFVAVGTGGKFAYSNEL
jgi:hypothetical protein